MQSTLVRSIAVGILVGIATTTVLALAPVRAKPRHHTPRLKKQNVAPVKMLDQKEVTIEMSLEGFDPPSIEIKTGTTVTWHNTEPADYPVVSGYHHVTADDGSFDSGKVAPGARWSFTFDKPGTYDYHCSIHSFMTGQIIVTGAPVKDEPKEERVEIVEPDPNDQQSWGYKPAKLNIEVGTTVTWVNNGAQDHTVTDDDGAFDSGTMKPGDKFTFTFKKAGVFNYKCDPHPWMKATITVSEPGKAPPPEEEEEDDSAHASSTSAAPPASSGGGSGPTTHYVNIVEGSSTDSWGYDPAALSVATGDTVVWKNTGSTDHTVTASDGSFDSGTLAPGETWEQTFDEEGEFEYTCTPHPFMVASLSVSDSPTKTGAAAASHGSASAPEMTMSDVAAPEEVAGDETDELAGAEPVALMTLSGKEASLGLVAGTLAAAVAFLVGQWWGYRIRGSKRLGAA